MNNMVIFFSHEEEYDDTLVKMSDERVYRILEAIHAKHYEGLIDVWRNMGKTAIRDCRRSKSLGDEGCICSEYSIMHCVGRYYNKKHKVTMGEELDYLAYVLGLLALERHATIKTWFVRLELTDKGRHYLDLYYSLLSSVDFFNGLVGKNVRKKK